MEHNTGMTADPWAGWCRSPHRARNAMGAIKAINAARMALRGDGQHVVSLDKGHQDHDADRRGHEG